LHFGLYYRSLPEELQGLTALVTLDLSHNALTELPGHIINTWATSGSLQQLNLSDNQLVQLPEELCRVTSLQELLLHHNDLLLLPSQVSSRTSGGMGF
jgi:Leucine-rich repeat (LRR) protein